MEILFLIGAGFLIVYFLPLVAEQQRAIKEGDRLLSDIKKENKLELIHSAIGVNINKQEVIFSNWYIKTYVAIEFSPMFKGVYKKEPKYKAGTICINAAEIVGLEVRLSEKALGNDDCIEFTVRFREQPDEYFFTASAFVSQRIKSIDLAAVINFFKINLPNIPIDLDRLLSSELS